MTVRGTSKLVLGVEDQRRVLDDPASPVDELGELGQRGEAGVVPGALDQALDRAAATASCCLAGQREHLVDVDALVPDVER